MLAVQQGVPMAQQPDYNQLVNWFVAACHQGPSSLSLVSQQWMGAQHASAEVLSWAQAKHDQLLPPPPLPPPPQQVPMFLPAGFSPFAQQGPTAAEMRTIANEAVKSKATSDAETKGCRRMRKTEFDNYLLFAGLAPGSERDKCPDFVVKWE